MRIRFFNAFYFAVAVTAVGACDYHGTADKPVLKQESEFAGEYIERLRAKDYEYVKRLMSPDVASRVNDFLLSRMAEYFQGEEPISIKLVDTEVSVINEKWYGNFTFEYEFEAGWNLANVALKRTASGFEIIDVNVYRTRASQKEINAFTLSGKTYRHYLILVAAVVIPLFILVTLYVCFRTPMRREKWLWMILMLPGVGAIQMNWTSGEYAFRWLSMHLLGTHAAATGPYASWIISASVPLGAILFWFRRKKFPADAGGRDDESEESPGVS